MKMKQIYQAMIMLCILKSFLPWIPLNNFYCPKSVQSQVIRILNHHLVVLLCRPNILKMILKKEIPSQNLILHRRYCFAMQSCEKLLKYGRLFGRVLDCHLLIFITY
jgi:hypothetical protein